ncbi:hypothetical protein BASA81_009845 [Batrachochytrium salamandrivorans]|nr:hypothetical protein BASA81_009845 [Batrachochytrium salamandrivorans]
MLATCVPRRVGRRTSRNAHNLKLAERLESSSLLVILPFLDLTDEQIKYQVSAFLSSAKGQQIKVLFLNNNSITDKGLQWLYLPPGVTNLNLMGNVGISDLGMCTLASKLCHLSQLNLSGITKLSPMAWGELGKHLVNVRVLELKRCALQDDCLLALFSQDDCLLQLRQLFLSGNFITDAGVHTLAKRGRRLRGLEVLALDTNRLTDLTITGGTALGDLLQQTRLREVNLGRNVRIGDIGANELCRMLQQDAICLRSLKFEGFHLSNDGYKELDRVTLFTRSTEFALVLNLLAKYARMEQNPRAERPSPFPRDLVRHLSRMLL